MKIKLTVFRFSNHPFFAEIPPRSRGNSYAREAERLLDLHNVSLTTIQTAVLLGAFYGTEGDALHENLYYSVACRIGCLLNLPECMADTPLNQEMGIRCKFLRESSAIVNCSQCGGL